ncbi:hypothetical protein [Marinimicrococcus flavescens]|uniref:Uncharacterized protein n=1 Tax=Marinimicrococcus flavescens TaxID=3031815 RepID=A0AAP3XSK4_9PROT|nr:hypothetical protein [Marinimicrococcus flavescens]
MKENADMGMSLKIGDFIGGNKEWDYDIKKLSSNAYIIARQTMSQEESINAAKMFTLSSFFTLTENLSYDKRITSDQARRILKRKIFEFASVLDSGIDSFENPKHPKF